MSWIKKIVMLSGAKHQTLPSLRGKCVAFDEAIYELKFGMNFASAVIARICVANSKQSTTLLFSVEFARKFKLVDYFDFCEVSQ